LQTKDGRDLYAKRKSTVETVFAIVKSAMRFRTFLLRGVEKASGEWTLVCTAYNFKHLHALVAARSNTGDAVHRLSHRGNRTTGCSSASYRR